MNLQNCIIDGFKTTKDWSLKITLVTRELDTQTMAELISWLNKEIISIDIPDDIWETKSQSQRLRDVLWNVWDKNHKDKFKTFVLYYNHILEQLIEAYKLKIDNV
jgi:hypothetical protein